MAHQVTVPATMESSTRRRGRGQEQGPGWRSVLELASSGLTDVVNGEGLETVKKEAQLCFQKEFLSFRHTY